MLVTKHMFHFLSSLMLSWVSISQTSCLTVTDRIIPGPGVRQETGVTSHGTPTASLLPHPDHQGWTVRVTQPLIRRIDVVRSHQEEQHTYYLNPLTLPVGLFACPSSVWGWGLNALATVVSPNRQLERHQEWLDLTWSSCLMALMIARSNRQLTAVDRVVEHKLEPDSRPLAEGRVTVSWRGEREILVTYPVNEDGRVLIRLSHLATALRQDHIAFAAVSHGRIELAAWHRDHLLHQWNLKVTAEQLEAVVRLEVPVMAPRSRWPHSLVFKIAMDPLPPVLPDPRSTIERLLIHLGLPVVASDERQVLVRREIEWNLQAMVEDNHAAGPGHWLAATVLLVLSGHRDTNRSSVTLSCFNIRTRELLARIDVTAGPDGLSGTLDVAAIRLQDLLRLLSRSEGGVAR
ncbi:MAG: hypothetical protein LZF62_480314 [Nitrospira sp.]|nr:MAG: hypothetical protein LZF62_480314 [Nitrospira sp.]